jgi:pyruvate dehydrogenase E2 component (dihydrolipoamide acetyltransferase)
MSIVEVKVPDIGDFKEVEVIELMVKPGDTIKVDQSLITVESDKASMEIPSSHAGVVKEIKVKVGDKVAEGSLVLMLEEAAGAARCAAAPAAAPHQRRPPAPAPAAAPHRQPCGCRRPAAPPHQHRHRAAGRPAPSFAKPTPRHRSASSPANSASTWRSGFRSEEPHHPARRAELRQGRAWPPARAHRQPPAAAGVGLDLLPWPSLDFSKFGPTELLPLSRIKKISGPNLHRNWVMIPHVTHFDEADVTDLEAVPRRFERRAGQAKSAVKLTMLAFVIKASVAALKKFPAI